MKTKLINQFKEYRNEFYSYTLAGKVYAILALNSATIFILALIGVAYNIL
jgi:hypothetical protein